jgi:hypothetical protein
LFYYVFLFHYYFFFYYYVVIYLANYLRANLPSFTSTHTSRLPVALLVRFRGCVSVCVCFSGCFVGVIFHNTSLEVMKLFRPSKT